MADTRNIAIAGLLLEGGMAAEIAQLDLAKALYGNAAGKLVQGLPQGEVRSVASEAAIGGYRRIGNELMAGCFDAAKGLIEGLDIPLSKDLELNDRSTGPVWRRSLGPTRPKWLFD